MAIFRVFAYHFSECFVMLEAMIDVGYPTSQAIGGNLIMNENGKTVPEEIRGWNWGSIYLQYLLGHWQ